MEEGERSKGKWRCTEQSRNRGDQEELRDR